ncbi:thrombospondin type-1 domain-containing protein 1 [Tiliqua scincoides]|uniref:thrombospondin type-1 domain-containing protein 1 n=1 Tax=Tiliqua scincoides TaxID=71010 RepID=UPI0034622D20
MMRMKQMLNDVSNLLLVVLCDYVLGTVEYLLLDQPTHVAFSNGTVSVGFQNYYNGNVTLKNTSILLIEASTNRTVTRKELSPNQQQTITVFECFHFKSAGNYWFKMAAEIHNGTDTQWNREDVPLHVKWPTFHIDLRKTPEGLGSSLQLGLFTNEYLCPMNETVISMDVILTSKLYELGLLISNETVGLRTSKQLFLSRSQWVTVDCHLVGQTAYIAVLLKSAETHSVIASTGPVDLVRKFGYRLTVAQEAICEHSVVISVISPPCASTDGQIAVFKDSLGPPGQRTLKLHESIVDPESNQMKFNCTLFDGGTNKYCFEFSHLGWTSSPPRAKECVLIQRNVAYWSLWQAWSPCSVSCGDGIRVRYRECLSSFPLLAQPGCSGRPQEVSPCSLEECSTTKSVPITSLHPRGGQEASNNLVTVTGISLCLSIIFATVLITLWRKLCKAQKCSTPIRCESVHSPNIWKNSDEENICQERQQRESFSEGGEALCLSSGEPPGIPLNFRRSLHLAQEEDQASASGSFQSNAQKIIPPIFSYRLAQQQLKEMKKKGLKETTKVYHVSQNPLTDTVVNTSVSTDNHEAAAVNKFRIKSPFLEQTPSYLTVLGDRPCSRLDFTLLQASPILSPSQSLIRRSQARYQDNKGEQLERGYPRSSQFQRSASFHESKKAKPFRKRSMSTLTPHQIPLYHYRARMWNHVPEGQHQLQSKGIGKNTDELSPYHSTAFANEPLTYGAQNVPKWEPGGRKLDLLSSHQPVSQVPCLDSSEQKRNRRVPFMSYVDTWRKEPSALPVKDDHQRGDTLSPAQYRKNKCQSFPSDPGYHFYDNTSFGLTESEQHMIDLPGYFGSNEEDETSTLSIEKLVL